MNEWRRYDGLMLDGPEMPCPKEFGLAIDDAVSKLRAMEWQPIETAPKNETVLVWLNNIDGECSYSDIADISCGQPYCRSVDVDEVKVTHWMPLPAPPVL